MRDFRGKLIALVIWNVSQDDDVRVYIGTLAKQGLDYLFKNEEKGWNVSLSADKIDNIEEVKDEFKSILLNADYFINLTMADMQDTDNPKSFISTGLKWK